MEVRTSGVLRVASTSRKCVVTAALPQPMGKHICGTVTLFLHTTSTTGSVFEMQDKRVLTCI